MTDWDKELAKIDKQLASMSDEELVAPPAGRPSLPAGPPAKGGKPQRASSSAPMTQDSGAPMSRMATFALYMRVILSVALAIGMMFWPYDAKCGGGLGLYLAAVVALVVSGVWSALWSWRHRAARLHSLSLLLLLWGLVLGALDILPRVGYAKPTLLHPAVWACK